MRLIARVLARQGFAVLTAVDGDQAIALFDAHREEIDGVVLDVMIPPNGVEDVLDHMMAAAGNLAVILSSGDSPSPEISSRIELHGASFLRKPYLPRALIELVDHCLAARP